MSRYTREEIEAASLQLQRDLPETLQKFRAILRITESPAFDRQAYSRIHDRLTTHLKQTKHVKARGEIDLMLRIAGHLRASDTDTNPLAKAC